MQQPQQFETGAPATEQDIQDVMSKTRSTRKHKRHLPLDEQKQEEIRQKIAASMARKAAKVRYTCPACGVTLTRVDGVVPHMARCCADLLDPAVLQQESAARDGPQLQQILTAAAAQEQQKRRLALEITFLRLQHQQQAAAAAGSSGPAAAGCSSDDDVGEDDDDIDRLQGAAAGGTAAADGEAGFEGGYSKQTRQRIQQAPSEIAAQLKVPLARAERLLRQAMRSVPIAVDSSTPLDVVAEDDDFVAVNKPVGFHTAPVHRWQGGSVVSMLLAHLAGARDSSSSHTNNTPAAAGSGDAGGPSQQQQPAASQPHAKPYVLHRLDYNTSGLLLFGKRREVVPGVSAQFRERRVRKEYLAIAVGVPAQEVFTVDAPIGHHPSHDTARCITPSGKPAVTHFEVLSANPDYDLRSSSSSSSAAGAARPFQEGELFHERGGAAGEALKGVALVRCFPKSGRTHQIRLHLAHLGHPLVGDEVYGVTGPWIGRQALHARALALTHPLTGRALRFVAPLHDDFSAALQALGLVLPADTGEQQGRDG